MMQSTLPTFITQSAFEHAESHGGIDALLQRVGTAADQTPAVYEIADGYVHGGKRSVSGIDTRENAMTKQVMDRTPQRTIDRPGHGARMLERLVRQFGRGIEKDAKRLNTGAIEAVTV